MHRRCLASSNFWGVEHNREDSSYERLVKVHVGIVWHNITNATVYNPSIYHSSIAKFSDYCSRLGLKWRKY